MAFNIVFRAFLLVSIMGTTALSRPSQKTGNVICCPPDLINGTMYRQTYTSTLTGTSTSQDNFEFNVDYRRKMIAVKGQVGGLENARVIIMPFFSFIINDEAKTCTRNTSIPYTPKKCLTDEATRVGPVYIGGLKATAYSVNVNGYSMFSTITDNCLAVTVTQSVTVPKAKVAVVTNTIYSNVQHTVDEAAFRIPFYCLKPV